MAVNSSVIEFQTHDFMKLQNKHLKGVTLVRRNVVAALSKSGDNLQPEIKPFPV
jgi:hypothetical protein